MLDIRTGKPMTRREALTGLSAIIATGCAPFVASAEIVGRGRGGLARGCGARAYNNTFKLPYVTTGLLACWDAEWNTQIGTHDSAITKLRDLSGNGEDLTLYSGSPIYEDKTIYYGTYRRTDISVKNATTIDASIVLTGLNSSLSKKDYPLMSVFNKAILTIQYNDSNQAFYSINRNGTLQFYPSNHYLQNIETFSGTVSFDGVSTPYVNGMRMNVFGTWVGPSEESTISLGDNTICGIRSVRVYDRQLDSSEISQNYEVDISRFD